MLNGAIFRETLLWSGSKGTRLTMGSTYNNARNQGGHIDYAKRMSGHTAAALVVFVLLQIMIIAKTGGSLLLHLGIVVAIGLFAMTARTLEHRWIALSQASLPDAGLATRFRTDLLYLWGVSLLSPLLWIPVAIVMNALFG
jgi:hypothetical protein